jgi:hypothetical protein
MAAVATRARFNLFGIGGEAVEDDFRHVSSMATHQESRKSG